MLIEVRIAKVLKIWRSTDYDLDDDYKPHEAVQKPINPPYQQAMEKTKKAKKNPESANNNNNNEDNSTVS